MTTSKYNLARLSALETELAVQTASIRAISAMATDAAQDLARMRAMAFEAGPTSASFQTLEDLQTVISGFEDNPATSPLDKWKADHCRTLVAAALQMAGRAQELRNRVDSAAREVLPLRQLVTACLARVNPNVLITSAGRGSA